MSIKAATCTAEDGTKIRYRLRGRGAPLTLIMGYTGSGKSWGEPFLHRLESDFLLVVIDNRGTGESDKPDIPWTILDMARDVAAVLRDAQLPRTHVFGVSMGGMIAQELALNFPHLVHGLVLGCTNCGIAHSIPGDPELIQKLMPDPQLSPRERARRTLLAIAAKSFSESPEGRAFVEERLNEMEGYPVTPDHTFVRQFEAISSFDSFDRLPQLKAPTLVITGDEDALIPPQNSEILASQIPNAKLQLIKGAGHIFFWEKPEETIRTVTEFLKALGTV